MKRYLSIFAVLSLASGVARLDAGDTVWRNVAVGGGGFVTGITFHPNEPDLFYCRTDVGGAYRWDQPKGAWQPLLDGINRADADLMGVTGVALDPNDPDRVYLACGLYVQSWGRTGAILRSSDRGATWSRTELPIRLAGNGNGRAGDERLMVDPNLGSVLYLASDVNGLWRSADSGVTWSRLDSFPGAGCNLVIADPASGGKGSATPRLYANGYSTKSSSDQWGNITDYTYSNPALYVSNDAGASWTVIDGTPAGHFASHAAIDASGNFFATFTNGLGPSDATAGSVRIRNFTTGAWTDITPSTGSHGYSGLSLDRSRPGTIVVSTLDRWWPVPDEIFRSTDNGATWQGILVGAPRDYSSAPYASYGGNPSWISDVEINPFNPDHILFTTGGGIFSTNNATAADTAPGTSVSWRFFTPGLDETVAISLATPTAGAPLVSAMGDVAGMRHDSLTTSPERPHRAGSASLSTCVSIDVAALAPEDLVLTGWMGNSVHGFRSTDGGSTWARFASEPALPGNDPGNIAISADGNRILWCPRSTAPFFSADDGATWTASTGVPADSGRTLQPVTDKVNPLRAYLFRPSTGRIYATTTGGASWSAVNITTLPAWSGRLRTVPGHEGHLWLTTDADGLYRSSDGGATWTRLTPPSTAWHIGLGKAMPGASYPTLFLHGDCDGIEGIFRSTDEGSTWLRINDDGHMYGAMGEIAGDQQVFGRVYLAAGGRGIVYGELALALPAFGWAPFTKDAAGVWSPPAPSSPIAVTYSATNLPAWAAIDSVTGEIRGTPTDPTGTISQATVVASAAGETLATMKLNLIVASPGNDLAPVNMSTRGRVGVGDQVLIAGFVVKGTAPRTFLIRGVGPKLAAYNVTGPLADPDLTVYNSQGEQLFYNNNWSESTDADALRAAFAATGAFSLDEGSKDAAVLVTLPPGLYTAKVSGVGETTGVALVELYDTSTSNTAGSSGLVNISTRAFVGAGDEVLIPGMVLKGGGTRRLLVRAVGPSLAQFNVNGTLSDPQITIMQGPQALASNDDWCVGNDADEIRTIAASVGAFSLPTGSRDAVLLTTMPEKPYTIIVRGGGESTGVALVEVYVVP